MSIVKTFSEFIKEAHYFDDDTVDDIYKELVDFYEPWSENSEGVTIEDYGDEGKVIKIQLTENGDYAVTEPDAMNPDEIFCLDIPKKFEKCVNGPGLHQYEIEDLEPDQLPEGSEPMCRVLLSGSFGFDDIVDVVNKILNVMDPNEYKPAIKGKHTHIIR